MLFRSDYVHKALAHADVVVMIGHDISEKPPSVLSRDTHKVIHINFYPADIDDVYVPTSEIVGDVSHTLWALAEELDKNPAWDFDYFYKVRDLLRASIDTAAADARFPVLPEYLVGTLEKAIPEDGILALDNGMYKIWFARNYRARTQNSVLLDNALATMGAGLPSGIATKLMFPEKTVVVVSGDGGIMMNIAELETACRLGLDLVVVVLSDHGYGMIRWKQEAMGMQSFGLRFNNPDFVKLAESFGAHGHLLASAQELQPLVEQCISSGGVHIIDVPIDYTHNFERLGPNLVNETQTI